MNKIFFILLILVGCNSKIIDGTTKKTFTMTLQEMVNELPESKVKRLDNAIKLILLTETINHNSNDLSEVLTFLIKVIDGKTADEIIEIGRRSLKAKQMMQELNDTSKNNLIY